MCAISPKAALRLMIVLITIERSLRDSGIDAHREGESRIMLRILEEICEYLKSESGLLSSNVSFTI